LFNEYGIYYENKRCHDGRKVRLQFAKAWRCVSVVTVF
jgi:hypothetical protein